MSSGALAGKHNHHHAAKSNSSIGDLKAGTKVWVFYQMQKSPHDPAWFAVDTHVQGYNRPQIGWSDRWQPAVVIKDFKESEFNPAKHDTYVKVRYEHRIWFDREQDVLNTTDTRNIEQAYYPADVRLTEPPKPSLSLFVVRWGNPNFGTVNDYDWQSWGEAGSNVSDTYICHMMQKGIRKVAKNDYEVSHFVVL
ncbi:Sphingosine kinase 2 [Perkinsus chesapeaki]|uniref:Sphingosine kinase 2 n=1 Tax=Perkinsus chesapeaki TaxID=330153 RepID=A0A7J6LFJ1_PERCH|nr:Sphingosine kinase 2 [Perkinsus chesapeaki]